MSAFPPDVFLTLVLLAGPALAEPCRSMRHIELAAAPSGQVQRVCISPGQTTLFSFDTPLVPGSVTLEGADGFTWVEPGASTLKLIPSEKTPLGRELRMTVRFADGTAPSSATFMLVAQAAEAASLVEVHRWKSPAESCQQELRAKKEETRLLREENARLRAQKEGPGGLTGLLASGVLGMHGVVAQDLTNGIARDPMNPLAIPQVSQYRAEGRVALEMSLENPAGAPTWRVERATLTHEGKQGQELKVLRVWQQEPLLPGQRGRVIVEAELPRKGDQGPYTLRLWDAESQRALTLAHVTLS